MKIKTPSGTIRISNSSQDRVWYFRTYPFKVAWYLEAAPGKQQYKRFALSTELSQFLLNTWGQEVLGAFTEAEPIPAE